MRKRQREGERERKRQRDKKRRGREEEEEGERRCMHSDRYAWTEKECELTHRQIDRLIEKLKDI